jgi:putative ABC transport system permease protein
MMSTQRRHHGAHDEGGPMFLAWREIAFARVRFGLMAAVVGLIAILVVILSGLSSGLVVDGVSGLMRSPIQAVAFAAGTTTDSAYTRSTVGAAQRDAWAEQPGITHAELLGVSIVNAHDGDAPVDLTLFGVQPRGFVEPAAAEGSALTAPDQVVLSSSARDAGVRLGDTVRVDRVGTALRVVGFTADQRTFGHVDVGYVPLATWQAIHAGVRPGQQPDASDLEVASVVALAGPAARAGTFTAGDAAADTVTRTTRATFGSSPGYTAETMTMTLIKAFLYAISALVVGAFFTLWTVQRTRELTVMRAMGASTRFLVRDGLLQGVVLLVVAVGGGVLVGLGLGALLAGTAMPFRLEAGPVLTGAALLTALGLLGAAVATVRIAAINPLTALGENR